jgi:hypothetical protein
MSMKMRILSASQSPEEITRAEMVEMWKNFVTIIPSSPLMTEWTEEEWEAGKLLTDVLGGRINRRR